MKTPLIKFINKPWKIFGLFYLNKIKRMKHKKFYSEWKNIIRDGIFLIMSKTHKFKHN
jgi:hypothetical protein